MQKSWSPRLPGSDSDAAARIPLSAVRSSTARMASCFRSPSKKRLAAKILVTLAACLAWTATGSAQPRAIDARKSAITVRVYKAGLFSALGHNHEIAAPIASGTIDTTARYIEIHVHASSLRVHDPNVSSKDRNEIQTTMLGRSVLDVERYHEIVFRSTTVESTGRNSWNVRGDLMLHGQTHPVSAEVSEKDGHYVGTSRFKQTDFGITPVKVAGGTIRVKNEVRIDFDIQPAL